MDSYTLYGELSDDCSVIKLHHSNMLYRVIDNLKGIDLQVTIEKLHSKRSNAQNRYLFGVVIPVIKRWFKDTQGENFNSDDIRAYIYHKVLGSQVEFKTILGEEVFVIKEKRFSQMTTVEFSEAKDKVQLYFGELGLEIPDPKGENILNDFL